MLIVVSLLSPFCSPSTPYSILCFSSFSFCLFSERGRGRRRKKRKGREKRKGKKDGNNGIDNWCKAGGIAGRGILLDWVRWFEKKNPGKEVPAPYTRYAISISDLEEVAKFQGTEFKPGDILLVRTGFVKVVSRYEPSDTSHSFVRWHVRAVTDRRSVCLSDVPTQNGANETDRQLHTQKESTFIG